MDFKKPVAGATLVSFSLAAISPPGANFCTTRDWCDLKSEDWHVQETAPDLVLTSTGPFSIFISTDSGGTFYMATV